MIYDIVLDELIDSVKSTALLETSFSRFSFPVVIMNVHSYIGGLFEVKTPDSIRELIIDENLNCIFFTIKYILR